MSKYNILKKEFLFESDRHFNECHASTLLALNNGRVISAWFAGTKEKNDDVAIWIGIRDNHEWKVKSIAKISNDAHWNPVLFETHSGCIHLYFKVGKLIPSWRTYVIKSYDEGNTWNEPIELVEGDQSGGRGPVRCKPIYSNKSNIILAPASIEHENVWDSFIDISTDDGISWNKTNVPLDHSKIMNKGIIQPALWHSKDDHFHLLARSTEGCIYRSDSTDSGSSWCEAYKTNLPNNNSGIDITKLSNGRLVLIYNPISDNWGKRTPLSICLSDDNGSNWHSEFDLEKVEGEYSYPAIISKNNIIHITHTWNRKNIEYWEIEVLD